MNIKKRTSLKINFWVLSVLLSFNLFNNYAFAQHPECYYSISCPAPIVVASTGSKVVDYNVNIKDPGGVDPLVVKYTFSGATAGNGTGSTGTGSTFERGTTNVLVSIRRNPKYCEEVKCSFTIKVIPNPPSFNSCPTPMTVYTEGECGKNVYYEAGAPESSLSYSFSGATSGSGTGNGSGSFFNVGITSVVVTATNSDGTSQCKFDITVVDETKPNAICKSPTIELGANGTANITASDIDNASNDACGISSVSIDKTSFDCSNLGENTVVLTVTDNNSNVATCDATVTVVDKIVPTAVCKNITVSLVGSSATITAADIDGGSTDNCGVAELIAGKTSFTCADLGENTVTLTVKDASGNSSTCDAIVTVKDESKPTAICKNASINLVNGTATLTAADIDGGSSDNCGISEMLISKSSFNCSNIGTQTVTLIIKDASGNSSSCDANVTVVGVIPTVEITQASQEFCTNSSIDLTANAVGGSSFTYAWSNNATTAVTSISASGDYSVTTTNNYGCSASDNITVNYSSPSALAAYTILATDEVEMKDKSEVQTGGVGVFGCDGEVELEGNSKITGNGTFARAKEIEVKSGSSVTTKYYTAVNVSLPNFKYNPYCEDGCNSKYHNNCSTNCKNADHVHCKSSCKETNHSKRCHSKYHKKCNSNCKNSKHSHCKPGCKNEEHNHCGESNCSDDDHHHCSSHSKKCNKSSNDISVGSNKTVTLTDSVYGKINIGKNSTVTFTSPKIYVKELNTSDDVTVKFSANCVEMMVCNKVELKEDNNFNSTGKSVLMYVEKDFKVNQNSTVKSSVYSQNDIKVKGSCNKVTKMQGMFIAEKVESEYATWNKNTECNSCNQFNKRSTDVKEDLSGLIDPKSVSLNVYPNPSNGSFGVDVVTSDKGNMNVTVIDMMGRVIYTEKVELTGPVFVPVNLQNITDGSYFVKVEINGKYYTKRLYIER